MDSDWPFYLGSTNAFLEGNSTGTIIRSNATAGFKWTDGGTTHMTLDTNGNLGIGTTIGINKLDVAGNINIQGGNGSYLTFNNGDANIVINNNGTGRDLSFKTYDGSSNAERMRIDKDGNVGIGTASPGAKFNVVGSGTIGWSDLANAFGLFGSTTAGIGIDDNEIACKGDMYFGTINSGNDIIIRAGGATQSMIVKSGGKVGIGTGTSPDAKLEVSGGIIAGGKITYTISSASLTTTGTAVAGLSTGTNGYSAGFVFTCFGGNGYQRIVYSCKNVSGTWDIDKDIDEGVNAFDVTYAADGSDNITFTFKSRSGTQSYTPRVTVEAVGSYIQTSYIN
jgi:hypothetical protein